MRCRNRGTSFIWNDIGNCICYVEFIVKKSMDDVSYEYKDGENILTIKKTLQD